MQPPQVNFDWLVTWERMNDGHRDSQVASILDSRLPSKAVCAFVEKLFADTICTFSERLQHVRNKGQWLYPAQYEEAYGKKVTSRIKCGHNPFLYARQVTNLRAEIDSDGFEVLLWDELPIDVDQINDK